MKFELPICRFSFVVQRYPRLVGSTRRARQLEWDQSPTAFINITKGWCNKKEKKKNRKRKMLYTTMHFAPPENCQGLRGKKQKRRRDFCFISFFLETRSFLGATFFFFLWAFWSSLMKSWFFPIVDETCVFFSHFLLYRFIFLFETISHKCRNENIL